MSAAVVIALVGIILSIIGATWRLCVIVTQATDALKALTKRIDHMDTDNMRDHAEMKKQLSGHEARILKLERRT